MKGIGSLEHSMFGDVAGGKVVRARGGGSLGVVAEAGDGSKAGLSSHLRGDPHVLSKPLPWEMREEGRPEKCPSRRGA